MEKRFTNRGLNQEARSISGIASVFYNPADKGTEYSLGDGMVERITRGAFQNSLNTKKDIALLWQHDMSKPMARLPDTLRLWESDAGLEFRADIVSTSYSDDAINLIKSGVVTGCSFGFVPSSVEWKREGKTDVRYIKGVELHEISIVTFPAFTSTNAQLRAERDKSNLDYYIHIVEQFGKI